MRPLDQLAEIAQEAVRIGNDLIKTRRPHTVTEKSDRDTYTDVDIFIERKIRAFLAEVAPEIGIVGEEEGQTGDINLFWALDPIDGTSNFAHGIPLCATQIALICNEEAIVSSIGLPYIGKHYWAIKNGGAYVNGTKLSVSTVDSVSNAIVSMGDYATGNGAAAKNKERVALTAALAEKVERIRMLGSAAHDLAWLAEGRVDASIILSNNTLDVAAGILLAREAGALVLDAAGDEHSMRSMETIATTHALARDIIAIVQAVQRK